MRAFAHYILVGFLTILIGCSAQKPMRPDPPPGEPLVQVPASLPADTLLTDDLQNALPDSFIQRDDSVSDSLTVQLLELSRHHYQNALEAQSSADTTRSQEEFEYAIAILNELAYYPNIENNREFNELSRSVIEDYEKYIASIDSLGPQTSIFALRAKLNQVTDVIDTADQDKIKEVITTPSIPLVVNGLVEQNMHFFQNRGRGHFEHWLYESGKYFPIMKKIFKEVGVPEEMIYLSMIESGLNPVARSWARAVGIWQFIKGTGRLYGLNGNSWYDERRDFEKASRAAARHLKDLYQEFSDWYLVLAAYNSGAGNVYRAIRKTGSTDFWSIRRRLPRETRNYVPSYIAAAVMALNPKAYGFDVTPADPLSYGNVTINECVDISVLAKCAETDALTIRELNPELLQWCTPPGYKGYALRVPVGKEDVFQKNYAQVPEDQKRDWTIHTIRKGETLGSIARKYRVTTAVVMEANHLKSARLLSIGKTLVIPVPPSFKNYAFNLIDEPPLKKSSRHSRKARLMAEQRKGEEKVIYKIKKGDTLGEIAHAYTVRVSDLRIWNEIPYGSSIRAGGELSIWVPKNHAEPLASLQRDDSKDPPVVDSKTVAVPEQEQHLAGSDWKAYRVKTGDNLGKIAKKNGVAIKDIMQWNGLRSDVVKAGDKLEILVEKNGSSEVKKPLIAQKDTSKTVEKKSTYFVKKGDSLYSIAAAFGISVKELKAKNRLRSSRIRVGQEIKVNS